jgi:DNA-binding transcriptional MerR regulator
MSSDFLETKDVVRHSGLSTHMVGYLCRSEILRPTLSKVRRRGLRRRFSFADLLLARAIAKLLAAKVEVSAIRAALRTLRCKVESVPPSVLATKRIVIVGRAVYLTQAGTDAVELTADGQLAFQFVLDTTDVRTRVPKSAQNRSRTTSRTIKEAM